MALDAGSRLGDYEILGSLGAGGMGEVYRAHDTRLGREVAIKILPAALAGDADRIARFEREARVLASLNHPNIAILHGYEQVDDPASGAARTSFLVMELVEGETLADRIERGPLPWREAVGLHEQIADALKAAHERGIVHRDLKPANVKIDPEGRVKVLDFGLARSAPVDTGDPEIAATRSPTLTAVTGAGVLLGTAAYMAPEQARGLVVDRRADVWAFGVCLFEALSGRRPFAGEDVSLTLAAILSQDADWKLLPDSTPPRLRQLLARCLEKDPKERLQDLGDARWWLARAGERGPADGASAPEGPRRVLALAAAALVVGLAIGALFGGRFAGTPEAPPPGQPLRFTAETEVPMVPGRLGREIAVSPDGALIAFAGRGPAGTGIYVHDLEQDLSRYVDGTEGGTVPFFAADGRSIGFVRDGALHRVAAEGGLPTLLTELAGPQRFLVGVSWGERTLVYGIAAGGLFRTPVDGGPSEPLASVGSAVGFPEVLPNGEALLFTAYREGFVEPTTRALDLETGEVTDLGAAMPGSAAQYIEPGHVVFVRDGGLWSVPFSAERLETLATPRLLLTVGRVGRFIAPFAVSRSGTFVTSESGASRLVTISPGGERTDLGAEPGNLRHPRSSPDGTRIAYTRGGVGTARVWIREIESGREARLTDVDAVFPVWIGDERLAFFHPTGGADVSIDVAPADRSAPPAVIFESRVAVFPSDVGPDGLLLFGQGSDILGVHLNGDGEASPWLATPATERNPAVSPDGDWVLYESDESGRFEVYLRRLGGSAGARPVSIGGGVQPAWSEDGRTLYYRGEQDLRAVDVDLGSSPPSLGSPRTLWPLEGGDFTGHRSYDTLPDGGFVAIEPMLANSRFQVIYNLGAELGRAGS